MKNLSWCSDVGLGVEGMEGIEVKRWNPFGKVGFGMGFLCGAMMMHVNVWATEFSGATFFGDSLTDSGYFRGVGKQPSFTTNPDPVWAANLAQRYGLSADPALELTPGGVNPLGGSNYAIGGARISRQDNFPDPATAPFILTIRQQIDRYLNANPKLNGQGLYAVWGGANDISGYLQSNLSGLLNPATQAATLDAMTGAIRGEAVNLGTQLQRLQNAGAGTVLNFNLPDLGRTPAGLGNPVLGAILTMESKAFNAQLNNEIGHVGGNVVALNAFGLFNEVLANPRPYGFLNVTDPACTTPDSSTCTGATLVTPDANRTYLFADDQHPTGAGHAILAQYAFSVLQAPGQIGMLAEAPLSTTQAFTRTVDDQLRSPFPQTGGVAPYASYEHGRQNLDQDKENTGLDRTSDSVSIGVNYGINSDLMVGAGLGLGHGNADFSQNAGGFKFEQAVAMSYLQYKLGAWKFHGFGLLGKLNYNDVQRRIVLGETTRSERGDTAGEQFLLRLGTRYDIDLDALVLSPLADITWQQINVDGYSENGADSTAMNFQSQRRRSVVASLGVEASGKFRLRDYAVLPFVKLAWDSQLGNEGREVRANVIGMAGSFGLPAYEASAHRTRLDLGVRVYSGKDTSVQMGYSRFIAGDAKEDAVQVALNMAF